LTQRMPMYIGDQAIDAFLTFCEAQQHERFFLISDENTQQVLGGEVHRAIQGKGWDVLQTVLNPQGLHTEETSLAHAMAAYDGQPRTFVSVGSGTLTDITRFTSHRSRNPFIAFPTAASVDAYTPTHASVAINKVKVSIFCQAPIAIFTHLPTVCASPRVLTASGFGDLLSKFTASADWKLTHLIWEAEFDPQINMRAYQVAERVVQVIDGISHADPESMAAMMQCQFDSGFCMGDFKNTSPASGGEHHIAHIWEMITHMQGREGIYHGQMVGVAMVSEAEWYDRLRKTSRQEAEQILSSVQIPDRLAQESALREALPASAEGMIRSNPILMQLSDPKRFAEVKTRILERWDEIQDTARMVPPPDQVRAWMAQVGTPTTPGDIGLSEDEAEAAINNGHYLRERFSANLLRTIFGW